MFNSDNPLALKRALVNHAVIGKSAAKENGLPSYPLSATRFHRQGNSLVMLTTDRYRVLRSTVPGNFYTEPGYENDVLPDWEKPLSRAMNAVNYHLVSHEYLARMSKAVMNRRTGLKSRLMFGEKALTCEATDATITAEYVEADFPRVDHLFSGWKPVQGETQFTEITFTPEYLADLARMVPKGQGLKIELGEGERRPVRSVWMDDTVKNEHLLQPRRFDN